MITQLRSQAVRLDQATSHRVWPISRYCKHLEVLAANSQEKRDKGTRLSKERHPARQAASARASSSRLYLRLRSGVSPRACCLQGSTADFGCQFREGSNQHQRIKSTWLARLPLRLQHLPVPVNKLCCLSWACTLDSRLQPCQHSECLGPCSYHKGARGTGTPQHHRCCTSKAGLWQQM